MEKPKLKTGVIPSEELVKACQVFLDFLESEDYHEDVVIDHKQDIFEKALEAFYGEDIWKWVNSKLI